MQAHRDMTIYAGADPGFPVGGGANPPGKALTYTFSQKLHEIKKSLVPGGGRGRTPLHPPL